MTSKIYRKILSDPLTPQMVLRTGLVNNIHLQSSKAKAFQGYIPSKMKAWYLTSFNGYENLIMGDIDVPPISTPKDILVKVKATSLNPLDIMMANGYGREMLSRIRNISDVREDNDFQIILGRDFSGEVVDVGMSVTEFSPGDEVWGAVFPSSQGTLAEYVTASEYSVSAIPYF